jgi:hypothetical protein
MAGDAGGMAVWPAPDSLLWWRWWHLTDASVGSKTPAVSVHRCTTGLISSMWGWL